MIAGADKERLRRRLRAQGFDRVGFAPVRLEEDGRRLTQWLEAGRHGSMAWMERDPATRTDVTKRWPEARTVVCLAMSYATADPDRGESAGEGRGWISRYAWGKDYHKLVKKALVRACKPLEEAGAGLARPYVDTGPLLERGFHEAGGVGWVGKNACLIHPDLGSWLFLGEIVTDLKIESDEPVQDHCADCTACLDACPTGALVGAGELDSRLCISYHTIENRENVPESLRPGMQEHVFGCDICQEVCPWNVETPLTSEERFRPVHGHRAPPLEELGRLDREAFDREFAGTPVRRARWEGFVRNVCIAMGNDGSPAYRPVLEALRDEGPRQARESAAWALSRLKADD